MRTRLSPYDHNPSPTPRPSVRPSPLPGGSIPDRINNGEDPAEFVNIRYSDQPYRPQYHPAYDPKTQSISPGLNDQLDGIAMDTRGIDQFRNEALRGGPSAWAQLAGKQQDKQAMQARGAASKNAAGNAAEARGMLAMRGGLSSGARERIGRDSMRSQLAMDQQIGQNADNNKTQIGMNDEQNRINELGQLPGMENQRYASQLSGIQTGVQGQQYDINNAVSQGDKRNLFNLQNYHEQMGAWGANKQANATADSGKK